jgi:hypothetical protein
MLPALLLLRIAFPTIPETARSTLAARPGFGGTEVVLMCRPPCIAPEFSTDASNASSCGSSSSGRQRWTRFRPSFESDEEVTQLRCRLRRAREDQHHVLEPNRHALLDIPQLMLGGRRRTHLAGDGPLAFPKRDVAAALPWSTCSSSVAPQPCFSAQLLMSCWKQRASPPPTLHCLVSSLPDRSGGLHGTVIL